MLQVRVIHGDLRDVDLSEATVVVTYLLPQAMADIAETHLIPLLRRERVCPSGIGETTVEGEPETREYPRVDGHGAQSHGVKSQGPLPAVECSDSTINSTQLGRKYTGSNQILGTCEDSGQNINSPGIAVEATTKDYVQEREEDSGRGVIDDVTEGRTVGRPCRIVCNTWGIPGLVPTKEAAVGMYMGVRLRLFTRDSLT